MMDLKVEFEVWLYRPFVWRPLWFCRMYSWFFAREKTVEIVYRCGVEHALDILRGSDDDYVQWSGGPMEYVGPLGEYAEELKSYRKTSERIEMLERERDKWREAAIKYAPYRDIVEHR